MDVTNRDLASLISVIPLLIIRQSSINITVQQFFFARKHRQGLSAFYLHQGLSGIYLHLRAEQFQNTPPLTPSLNLLLPWSAVRSRLARLYVCTKG